MAKSSVVTVLSDREVQVERRFEAPRTLVWRAFTEPALIQKWMLGPPGFSMPICEMDVRTGGAYRWGWSDGKTSGTFGFHGTYSSVVPMESFAHNEIYDPPQGSGTGAMANEMLVTIRFEDLEDGGTIVTTSMVFENKEARDGALSTGMTDGMEMSYAQLDAQAQSFAGAQ
ncbi:MAG: SRPBCC domain-containing protein [Pseudomonadota bacterium]